MESELLNYAWQAIAMFKGQEAIKAFEQAGV